MYIRGIVTRWDVSYGSGPIACRSLRRLGFLADECLHSTPYAGGVDDSRREMMAPIDLPLIAYVFVVHFAPTFEDMQRLLSSSYVFPPPGAAEYGFR